MFAATVEATYLYGKQFAAKIDLQLASPTVICLYGTLGAGKTSFVKGFSSAFGIDATTVSSPTFQYLNIYKNKDESAAIFHFDLYRLHSADDFLEMGFDEFLHLSKSDCRSIVCIEWAERLQGKEILPSKVYKVQLSHHNDGRIIEVL